MKAVILVAGFGSRLRPLTDEKPKSLLPIGDTNTLTRMVKSLQAHEITEFIFVTGHYEGVIEAYVREHFPDITAHFVTNQHYNETNTGYSLMITEEFVRGDTFIKLDGDVNLDPEILNRLMATPDDANYICLDKSDVDDEVIKAEVNTDGVIVALGKYVEVEKAVGESIGIEKISAQFSDELFDTLHRLLADKTNWQEYYEYAYDDIIKRGVSPFKFVDISGLRWVEMDNLEDYNQAQKFFG